MRAISLFSGVGGFELGFERAGIETVLQAEMDPMCQKVLAYHWPDTARVADVRDVSAERLLDPAVGQGGGDHVEGVGRQVPGHAGRVRVRSDARDSTPDPDRRTGTGDAGGDGIRPANTGRRLEPSVDLVYGGFPCQDLSVAGRRAGLAGERSGLFFEFARVVSELRPRWFVAENVAGLLSSVGGRDFGVVIDTMDELGYGLAWAILDAQNFGVPQRRRRVFIVGCLGDPARAARVLSVCEGGCGDPPPSREARQGVAGSLGGGSGGRGWCNDLGRAEAYIPVVGPGSPSGSPFVDVSPTLRAGKNRTGGDRPIGTDVDTCETLQPTPGGGVRRLTPLECERLMGWPDNHTAFGLGGARIANSHRYRMCGNGVVAPVAEWIGHRLVAFS